MILRKIYSESMRLSCHVGVRVTCMSTRHDGLRAWRVACTTHERFAKSHTPGVRMHLRSPAFCTWAGTETFSYLSTNSFRCAVFSSTVVSLLLSISSRSSILLILRHV